VWQTICENIYESFCEWKKWSSELMLHYITVFECRDTIRLAEWFCVHIFVWQDGDASSFDALSPFLLLLLIFVNKFVHVVFCIQYLRFLSFQCSNFLVLNAKILDNSNKSYKIAVLTRLLLSIISDSFLTFFFW